MRISIAGGRRTCAGDSCLASPEACQAFLGFWGLGIRGMRQFVRVCFCLHSASVCWHSMPIHLLQRCAKPQKQQHFRFGSLQAERQRSQTRCVKGLWFWVQALEPRVMAERSKCNPRTALMAVCLCLCLLSTERHRVRTNLQHCQHPFIMPLKRSRTTL